MIGFADLFPGLVTRNYAIGGHLLMRHADTITDLMDGAEMVATYYVEGHDALNFVVTAESWQHDFWREVAYGASPQHL